MIENCFGYVARMVTDLDRIIFVITLALELEELEGKVKPNERRFLISPEYAAAFADINRKDSGNKSQFDWMSQDQWFAVTVLASIIPCFADVPRMIGTDGTETQWRQIVEADVPEICALPQTCNIASQLTPLQKLLVMRAIRSDRILPAAMHFIKQVLGKRYAAEPAINLEDILVQSEDSKLILLIYRREPDIVFNTFLSWTHQLGIPNAVLPSSQTVSPSGFENFLETNVNAAASKNGWLLVREIGRNHHLFSHILSSIRKLDNVPPMFRCVLSMDVSNVDAVPTEVLHHCLRVSVDSPVLMRSSLIYSMVTMDPDQLRQSPRSEWPILVHNLCFLHAAIRLRTRYGTYGWSRPKQLECVSHSDLLDGMTLVVNCLMDNPGDKFLIAKQAAQQQLAPTSSSRTSADSETGLNAAALAPTGQVRSPQLPWVNMRHSIAEIYGKYLTEENDRATLAAMVDIWVSPNSIKREFEVMKRKFFFNI